MNRGIGPLFSMLAVLAAASACDQKAPKPIDDEPSSSETAADDRKAPTRPTTSEQPDRRSIIRPSVQEETPDALPLEPARIVVRFDEMRNTLDDGARSKLDDLLQMPLLESGSRITIRGHTDSHGYDGDNLVVSRLRAEAVKRYLEENGVASERIEIIALGEANPVAPNAMPDGSDNPQGRAMNRRVEIEVLPPDAKQDGRVSPSVSAGAP